MNLKFEGNQVTYFFKLNHQYFFYSECISLKGFAHLHLVSNLLMHLILITFCSYCVHIYCGMQLNLKG